MNKHETGLDYRTFQLANKPVKKDQKASIYGKAAQNRSDADKQAFL